MNTINPARCLATFALALTAGLASAASVSITGWTYGAGKQVQATGFSGAAGGLTASLSGAGSDNAATLSTYAVDQGKALPSDEGANGYSVEDGGSYFQRYFNDAGIATRLERLMSVVAASPKLVDTAAESAGLQLAVWNLIYDTDYTVSSGKFKDTSKQAAYANQLLALARGQVDSVYTLKVLDSKVKEDLFYLVPATPAQNRLANQVPEPGALALVALCLLCAGVISLRLRRRRLGPVAPRDDAGSAALLHGSTGATTRA